MAVPTRSFGAAAKWLRGCIGAVFGEADRTRDRGLQEPARTAPAGWRVERQLGAGTDRAAARLLRFSAAQVAGMLSLHRALARRAECGSHRISVGEARRKAAHLCVDGYPAKSHRGHFPYHRGCLRWIER